MRLVGGFDQVCDVAVEQIGVKNDHNAAFCDEELRFGIVMEETMKSKTGYRAKYLSIIIM